MQLRGTRQRRLAGAALAAVLAVSGLAFSGVSPAGAADALPPAANPIADGAFCDGAPTDSSFSDLGAETPATRTTIYCLVATEVTSGVTSTTYNPGGSVTRRQMALFIKRLADLANALETSGLTALPAYDGTPDYSDIAAESDAVKAAVGQLSQAGIVLGTSATRYSPSARVSRRQMAAFVNRLEEFLTGAKFESTGNYFDDDNGDPGEPDLNAMASVGIFQGDGAGHVFPNAGLTRRQMANILMRDAQAMLEDGDIKRPFANQSFSVTPTETATIDFVDNPGSATTETPSNPTDDRQYTATGLTAGTVYKIALLPAAMVRGTTNAPTFVDANSDNRADGMGTPDASISLVNGQPNSLPVASAQPIEESITFTVDGDDTVETVVPVLWLDQGAYASELDLVLPAAVNADPKPSSEKFGIGGVINYAPTEAPSGVHTSADVVTVNLAANYVTTQTDQEHAAAKERFDYDADDVYRYNEPSKPLTGLTLAQFEAMISPGDVLTVTYNAIAAGASTFEITNDNAPVRPLIKMAEAKNVNGGAKANDVQITFDPHPNNAAGVIYTVIQRQDTRKSEGDAPGTADDKAPLCSDNEAPTLADPNQKYVNWTSGLTVSAVLATNADGSRTFTVPDLDDGCYDYQLEATNPVSAKTAGTDPLTQKWWSTYAGNDGVNDGVQVPPAFGPLSTSMRLTTDTEATGLFEEGDVLTVVFDRPMGTPAAGWEIALRDGDGTVASLICGTNAFCRNFATPPNQGAGPPGVTSGPSDFPSISGDPRTVLTFRLTQSLAAEIGSSGTVAGMSVATGVAIKVTDVAEPNGSRWYLPASPDRSLAT